MNEKIKEIAHEWTKGLDQEEAFRRLFEKVRDIPYGVIGSRNPLKVLEAHKGTCSGKHFLLAALYRAMGIDVKDIVAFHRYCELPRNKKYPDELKELLEKGDGVPDYHNFIKININREWLIIDATFEKSLQNYFVVNEWGGKNMKLTVKPLKIWETENPVEFKVRMLNQLPSEIQEYRERFLNKFSEWLDFLRKEDTLRLPG